MPQQADPCENNPCGKNNLCTSNGGAVSCECAPGKTLYIDNISKIWLFIPCKSDVYHAHI